MQDCLILMQMISYKRSSSDIFKHVAIEKLPAEQIFRWWFFLNFIIRFNAFNKDDLSKRLVPSRVMRKNICSPRLTAFSQSLQICRTGI